MVQNYRVDTLTSVKVGDVEGSPSLEAILIQSEGGLELALIIWRERNYHEPR